jgi:hypothetical protein
MPIYSSARSRNAIKYTQTRMARERSRSPFLLRMCGKTFTRSLEPRFVVPEMHIVLLAKQGYPIYPGSPN